jgi:hypothetical protein
LHANNSSAPDIYLACTQRRAVWISTFTDLCASRNAPAESPDDARARAKTRAFPESRTRTFSLFNAFTLTSLGTPGRGAKDLFGRGAVSNDAVTVARAQVQRWALTGELDHDEAAVALSEVTCRNADLVSAARQGILEEVRWRARTAFEGDAKLHALVGESLVSSSRRLSAGALPRVSVSVRASVSFQNYPRGGHPAPR